MTKRNFASILLRLTPAHLLRQMNFHDMAMMLHFVVETLESHDGRAAIGDWRRNGKFARQTLHTVRSLSFHLTSKSFRWIYNSDSTMRTANATKVISDYRAICVAVATNASVARLFVSSFQWLLVCACFFVCAFFPSARGTRDGAKTKMICRQISCRWLSARTRRIEELKR